MEKKGMRYDIVIANPPYGKIGNEITKAVIDNIDYDVFVNLLPANDYRKNKDNALWQFVDINSMCPVQDGFKDAAVTTMMCKVKKERSLYISEDEFEIENYSNPILKRYFYENRKRNHYAIDNAQARPKWKNSFRETINQDNSFIIHMRDANHGYIPKEGKATSVKWNLKTEKLDIDYLHENYWQNDTQSVYGFITFKTSIEKDNFTKFMLGNGWDFMCKVLQAMHVDSTVPFGKYLPKVDWTRPQTVQTILADYGYTPSEIGEVVADLANFKSFGKGIEK